MPSLETLTITQNKIYIKRIYVVGSRSPPPFHFLCKHKLPCISEKVGIISIRFMVFTSLLLPRKCYSIVGGCLEHVFTLCLY